MKYDFEQAVSMARASWRRIAPVPVPPNRDPSIGDAGFQILPGDVSLAIQVAWVEVEDGKEKLNVHWQYISSGCPFAVKISGLDFKLRLPSSSKSCPVHLSYST